MPGCRGGGARRPAASRSSFNRGAVGFRCEEQRLRIPGEGEAERLVAQLSQLPEPERRTRA